MIRGQWIQNNPILALENKGEKPALQKEGVVFKFETPCATSGIVFYTTKQLLKKNSKQMI